MQSPALLASRKGCAGVMKPASAKPVAPRHTVVVRSTGWADPKVQNAERAMWGDNFGARDPFAAEIASNFGEKVLGNFDTEHIIKVPTKIGDHLGVTAKNCVPASELSLLDEKSLNLLKNQVPGWRVYSNAAGQAMSQEWKLKDAESAAKLVGMVQEVATAQQHPAQVTQNGEVVAVELNTPSLGGLTINDIVLADKINHLDVKDLLAKKKTRFWA